MICYHLMYMRVKRTNDDMVRSHKSETGVHSFLKTSFNILDSTGFYQNNLSYRTATKLFLLPCRTVCTLLFLWFLMFSLCVVRWNSFFQQELCHFLYKGGPAVPWKGKSLVPIPQRTCGVLERKVFGPDSQAPAAGSTYKGTLHV